MIFATLIFLVENTLALLLGALPLSHICHLFLLPDRLSHSPPSEASPLLNIRHPHLLPKAFSRLPFGRVTLLGRPPSSPSPPMVSSISDWQPRILASLFVLTSSPVARRGATTLRSAVLGSGCDSHPTCFFSILKGFNYYPIGTFQLLCELVGGIIYSTDCIFSGSKRLSNSMGLCFFMARTGEGQVFRAVWLLA